MGTTIADMYYRYMDAISDGIYKEDAILESDIELIDVNKDDMLHGLNAMGMKISDPPGSPYKSDRYAQKKQGRNALPPYGVPDLLDKGDFYERIEFHIAGRILVWEDSDAKAPDLLAKYGSVLGVFENDALQKWRRLYLYPALARYIKRKTGMK